MVSDWWNWAHFRANFRKFWKFDPCLYQLLHWIRGHRYTRRLILRPISAAHPRIDLCTKNPPGPNTKQTFHVYLYMYLRILWTLDLSYSLGQSSWNTLMPHQSPISTPFYSRISQLATQLPNVRMEQWYLVTKEGYLYMDAQGAMVFGTGGGVICTWMHKEQWYLVPEEGLSVHGCTWSNGIWYRRRGYLYMDAQGAMVFGTGGGVISTWMHMEQWYLVPEEGLPVHGCACRVLKFGLSLSYFCPHLLPISLLTSYKQHNISLNLSVNYNNLLKIHPIYVNLLPLAAMRRPRSLYQNCEKSNPKCRHIYHVNVNFPPPPCLVLDALVHLTKIKKKIGKRVYGALSTF